MRRATMFSSRLLRSGLGVLALGLLSSTAACSTETEEDVGGDENDLTSVTARARTLEFQGTVYVEPNATADQILQTVRAQTQTAFGPLRTSDMAVNSRELKEVDPATFVKRNVKVVDVGAGGASRDMVEVKYTYKDDAVVGLSLATRSTAPLALMHPGYRSQTERILRECTPNDSHAREFASTAWYIFEPKLPQCQEAIRAEQTRVDADRARLTDARTEVAKSAVDRLYIPITVKLGADRTNRGNSYPDYHRLYRGGVKENKLVVSLVFGMIGHDAGASPSSDYNWGELMTTLRLVMEAQGEFRQVQGPDAVDLSSFRLSSGRTIERPSIADLVNARSGSSLGLSWEEGEELQKLFADRINKKWLTIEHPIKVAVGNEAPRDFGIQLMMYFGAGSDPRIHRYATKNSDVFIYNGHSSIGYGPLDPRNFTAADFPASYQILWMDGCVSYNYYHKDYIPLKQGGTKNLDLVTNGLEAPAFQGGKANGQFLVTLLNGRSASYKDLLLAARDTEAMRVVDGELDNEYKPTTMRVTIQNR